MQDEFIVDMGPGGGPPPMMGGPQFSRVDRKDDGFLQWFLDTKKEIDNLKFIWRGWEENSMGVWVPSKHSDQRRMMNDDGIHWATSILRSYLNKNFQATAWDSEHMNYEMRQAARIVWHTLQSRYKEFGLSKVNASAIGRIIMANVHTMMLSARAAGIRSFIGTTQTVSESRVMGQPQQKGIMGGLGSIFKKQDGNVSGWQQ